MSENKDSSLEQIGVTSSPSTTTEISIDITSTSRNPNPSLLGKMVFVKMREAGQEVLALGQITSVETRNRWHEDMAFKGVIKQQGSLPNLSGTADTRLANISVQSCFTHFQDNVPPTGHVLAISPSTGQAVEKMNDTFMRSLVNGYGEAIQYIGTIYGSEDVNMPMWFKHFGKSEGDGDYTAAGDALHIGVFGKTGSGKTVMSSLMLLSYARNKKMNILVFDPQGQFYKDTELLPSNKKLSEAIESVGSKYKTYKLIKDISLPNDFELFGNLLLESGYIRQAFNLTTDDKKEDMKRLIVHYLFNYNEIRTLEDLIIDNMLNHLKEERNVNRIYQKKAARERLTQSIQDARNDQMSRSIFDRICKLFTGGEKDIEEVIKEVIFPEEKGNFVIIDTSISDRDTDKYQPLFLELIEKTIVKQSEELYGSGKKLANTLVVMDEAHRFISKNPSESRIRELTRNIVDAVRTTRKYGVGHMFITQTLESLDDEIVKQLRIHVFGYGLTTGDELRKIRNTVNSDSALNLYKSFIDPSNTKRYPFMFLGAVSPLSLSGSPLFIEAYNKFEEYENNNQLKTTDKDQ